jgi:hypothetical protein
MEKGPKWVQRRPSEAGLDGSDFMTMAGMRARRRNSVWARLQQISGNKGVKKAREFATILMLTAVVGAICQVVDTIVGLGRSAGWWP